MKAAHPLAILLAGVLSLMTIALASTAYSAVTIVSHDEAVAHLEEQIAALKTALHGKRVGLITNPTGVDGRMALIADRLAADRETTVTAFFAPEHGVRGDRQAGASVDDYIDPVTGIPVFSIYGSRLAPTDQQLETVDALVFDIQDVGVRFYTYVWTMTYCMEAAAKNAKAFYVFDRPNPLGGMTVEGAPSRIDSGLIGRVWPGQPWGVATRHGMTPGELATLVNAEWLNPKVNLTVIRMPAWTRDQVFETTGRLWILPSPNMPTVDTAAVYPGTCVFEGTNLSEGRGTTRPFELIGAPFIDATAAANALNEKALPGVVFRPAYFAPTFSKWVNQRCGGVQVHVIDRQAYQPVRTGLVMLKTLYDMYPADMTINNTASKLMGIVNLHERIKTESVESIEAGWQADLAAFLEMRARHLLYSDATTPGRGFAAR